MVSSRYATLPYLDQLPSLQPMPKQYTIRDAPIPRPTALCVFVPLCETKKYVATTLP